MATLTAEQRRRRWRINTVVFGVFGLLFGLLGLLAQIWPFALIGAALALIAAYGWRGPASRAG